MKNNIKIAIFSIALSWFAVSCEKNDSDTQKPFISVSGPEENEVLFIGNEIHFDVDFSDDRELKSYKVDIHSNFDGHSHKTVLTGDSIAFSYQNSWNFDAGQRNAHIHHHEIVIPDEIDGKNISQGDYHFMIYCTDAAGNESWTAIPVKIMNSDDSEAPVFSALNGPAANQEFQIGDIVSLSGTVSDNIGLDGVLVAIMPENATNEQVNASDCFAVMLHEHDAVHEHQSYNFSASITVGQTQDNNNPPKNITWSPGNYFIIIKSPDESGNIAYSQKFDIVVK